MTSKQLKDTPLPELKRIALKDLNLTKDQVREYGHLSYRATWENAISDIRDGIKQLTISDAPLSFSEEPKNPAPKSVEQADITKDCQIAIELGWASPLAKPFLPDGIFEIIVNPAKLIQLSQTHKYFKDWQPWMDIGCQFALFNGSIYTILYFDVWGSCLTLQEDSKRPATFSLTTIATLGIPISKNNRQSKTATSNELEVAALKNGFLHQGSKKDGFANSNLAEAEAELNNNSHLTTEQETEQPLPEIINITPEEYPEIWELLQPPDPEEKQENCTINLTTYEVVETPPEPNLYTFESTTESLGKAHPKLPLEDFFKALFLGLPVLVPNQLA